MTRNQRIALAILAVLLMAGIMVHWLFPWRWLPSSITRIPWSSADLQDYTISFLSLLATLIGFAVAVYQLGETERAIHESNQKPALQLEVLPPTETLGIYPDQVTHKLDLHKNDKSTLETHCALKIRSSGTKAASRIYLTFTFKRREILTNEPESKLRVDLVESQDLPKTAYRDAGTPFGGQQAGWDLKFTEDFVIHPDDRDRPVVAILSLTMKDEDFEPDYAIHYRIHSYEGNDILEASRDKKTGRLQDQIYPITFNRVAKPVEKPATTSYAVADAGSASGTVGMSVDTGVHIGMERDSEGTVIVPRDSK
jgi:hypothetical protein